MKKIQKCEKMYSKNGPYATQFKGQLQPLGAIIHPPGPEIEGDPLTPDEKCFLMKTFNEKPLNLYY